VSLFVDFDKGHSREAGQKVNISVVRARAQVVGQGSVFSADRLFDTFATLVSVESPAQLVFQTARGYNGRFLVTIALQDDGGTANAGRNRREFTFTLAVEARTSFPYYSLLRKVELFEMQTQVRDLLALLVQKYQY
jgi:hypothetical protein